MTCPCGVGDSLDGCCGPIVRGEAPAETAEALMRSRYSAYTLEAMDYIVESHDPKRRDDVDREAAARWAREAEWLGLEVRSTEGGGPADDTGMVEFVARYRMAGGEHAHHERATFRRLNGRWYFEDGEIVKTRPVVRETPKVGRNEPCPCGSGRKFKKCHGAGAA